MKPDDRFPVTEDYATYRGGRFQLDLYEDEHGTHLFDGSFKGASVESMTLGDLRQLRAVIDAALARFDIAGGSHA
jgi:hypothetical protein